MFDHKRHLLGRACACRQNQVALVLAAFIVHYEQELPAPERFERVFEGVKGKCRSRRGADLARATAGRRRNGCHLHCGLERLSRKHGRRRDRGGGYRRHRARGMRSFAGCCAGVNEGCVESSAQRNNASRPSKESDINECSGLALGLGKDCASPVKRAG
jgi:hypothetical protein